MARNVSSVSWFSDGPHLRVYLVNGSKVIERAYDGGDWYNGDFSENGVVLGSTSWSSPGQIHIRVYVADSSNGLITEYCWDKDGWYQGDFGPQTRAKGESASATSWLDGGQIHLRVYVRSSDGQVTEYGWDGGKWYTGDFTQ